MATADRSRESLATSRLLALHGFATVTSLVLAKSARDALFLGHHTAGLLTVVDLATAALATAGVAVQLWLNARTPTRRLLLWTPLCCAVGDAALWLGISRAPESQLTDALTWIAYVWIGLQASFAAPQSSVLASLVLTLREAKERCGLIGTGAILGWIAGGLVAQRLAPTLGAPFLLLAASSLQALCPIVAWYLCRGTAREPAISAACLANPCLRQRAAAVWSSPYLRAIAVATVLSAAVTTVVGFQFKDAASRSIRGTDQLASFFGSFSVHTGLVALIVQTCLTRHVVATLGPGLALMTLPAALASGSIVIMTSSALATAAWVRGVDQVVRHSVDRAAIDLAYRPLPREQIVDSKLIVDVLVGRVGDAAGGLLVWLLAFVLHVNTALLSALSLAMIAAWFVAAASTRRRYPVMLRRRIASTSTARRDLDAGGSTDDDEFTHGVAVASGSRARAIARAFGSRRLPMALGVELVNFALLVEAGCDSTACRNEGRQALSRIGRLLHRHAPRRYPPTLSAALLADDAAAVAFAVEYLDATLPLPHRALLVRTLERWSAS